jgi:hypothetical protein
VLDGISQEMQASGQDIGSAEDLQEVVMPDMVVEAAPSVAADTTPEEMLAEASTV